MSTNAKPYKIVDITDWKHDASARRGYHGFVHDHKGTEYLAKGDGAMERTVEMVVSKACEKANFDAIKNEFAYNNVGKLRGMIAHTPLRHIIGGVTPTLTLISPYLDYEIEPLGKHVGKSLAKQNAMQTHIGDLFGRQHLNLNDKFKKRYVDEVLLRSLFEDNDSILNKNVFVKKPENQVNINGVILTPQETGSSFTKLMPPELELTPSIDFDRCLTRLRNDWDSTKHSHAKQVTENLRYIRKHYPQNAEKFFADFSFDSATLDELFDLNGVPLEWLMKHPLLKTTNCLSSLSKLHKSLTHFDIKLLVNKISKLTRLNFEQNLAFMKEEYTKQ